MHREGGDLSLSLCRWPSASPIWKSDTYEVKNPQGTAFRKFYKKTKSCFGKTRAHTNFHQNPTVGSKVLLHTADPNCPLYEVKNLQGTDFRKFYKKPKFTIIFSSAHSNFHQNLTVGSKDLLHTANSDFWLYEVKKSEFRNCFFMTIQSLGQNNTKFQVSAQ